MNVRCASCETVYRVDPDRLPLRGVRARCTVCSHVISIEGQSFGSIPEAAPNRTFAPATRDRVANSLGDAFIAPPEDSRPTAPTDTESVGEPDHDWSQATPPPVVSEDTTRTEPIFLETELEPADTGASGKQPGRPDEVEMAEAEGPGPPIPHAPARDIEPASRTPPRGIPEPEPDVESQPQAPVAWEPVEQEPPSVEEPVFDAPAAPEPSARIEELPTQRAPGPQEKPPVVPPWEEVAARSASRPPTPPSPVKAVPPEPALPTPGPSMAEQTPKAPRPFAGAGQGRPTISAAPTPPPDGRTSRQRLSRPFSVPRSPASSGAPPGPATVAPARPKAEPDRPAAPVFTPSSGRPVQPPPVPPRQPAIQEPAAAPVAPPKKTPPPVPTAPIAPAPPPSPAPAVREPTGRPVNPFLSRDPRQKARRLARALISDMIVYQPEKRQRAMREGNLKEAFDEEIRKSWGEFVEQVGQEIAESTTHFNDALNDILAGGQKVF